MVSNITLTTLLSKLYEESLINIINTSESDNTNAQKTTLSIDVLGPAFSYDTADYCYE